MFARAAALAVNEEQRRQLDGLVRTGATPQRIARKCQVVLLATQGVSNHSIAQQTGLSRPTVLAVRASFAKRGIDGICEPRKRKRSRPVLTSELERKILDTTLKTRPADATHWSARVLAAKLGVSRMMVQRVWQRFDIQPHRVEKFKISKDPKFEDKVRDVVGLYLNPPDRALVLCIDEKSQIQALDRTAPILPLRPGLPERQTHDYKRNGTTTLFAAFNILNGKVIGSCCRGIGARSSLSSSINLKKRCLRSLTSISFSTTTVPIRVKPSSVGSSQRNAGVSTSTSHPPAVPGSIRWNAGSDSSPTK
jgi:transposase